VNFLRNGMELFQIFSYLLENMKINRLPFNSFLTFSTAVCVWSKRCVVCTKSALVAEKLSLTQFDLNARDKMICDLLLSSLRHVDNITTWDPRVFSKLWSSWPENTFWFAAICGHLVGRDLLRSHDEWCVVMVEEVRIGPAAGRQLLGLLGRCHQNVDSHRDKDQNNLRIIIREYFSSFWKQQHWLIYHFKSI
jgi:hypothetical protein